LQLTDVGVPTRAQRLIGVGPHLLTAGILAAFVLLAANFAHVQTVWVDETTQLSGLTLSPAEQLPWLVGENANRFGVPPDRQPPLSYFLGWTWSRIFGLTPLSMRYFGLAAVALAGLFVAATATRVSGPWGGPLAATLFLLSPNVLGTAPEIRPYGLLVPDTLCATAGGRAWTMALGDYGGLPRRVLYPLLRRRHERRLVRHHASHRKA
jgi:hypothetical protein